MRPLPLTLLAVAVFSLTAGPCLADQQALALLNKVEMATRTAGTLSAKFTYSVTTAAGETRDEGTVRLMKPNYARIAYRPAGMNYSRLIVSDGRTLWQVTLPDNKVTQEEADPKGQNIRVFGSLLIQAFFNAFTAVKQNIDGSDALDGVKYGGTQTVDGARCETLVSHHDGETDTLFVGPDNVIRRYVAEFSDNGKPGHMEATFSDVQTGSPMSTLDFLYTPPPPRPAPAPAPPLLANGTNAPDFTLPGRDGAPHQTVRQPGQGRAARVLDVLVGAESAVPDTGQRCRRALRRQRPDGAGGERLGRARQGGGVSGEAPRTR